MSDVKILSERNPYAKTAWITVRNTHGKNRLQVVLELDGEEDILEDTWVPCLDDSECLHLQSHQVTNLFKGRDEEIKSLKEMIVQARPFLQYLVDTEKDSLMQARDWLELTKEIKVD